MVISVTDANNHVTSYQYDGFGQLTKLISPDTGVTTFKYDTAGNLIEKTDARNIIYHYQYDALNRLTNVTAGNEVQTYEYDGNGDVGQLTRQTDSSGSTTFDYNIFGELIKTTNIIQGQSLVTQYVPDNYGRLKDIIYPSGNKITYSYNNIGKVSGVTAVVGGVTKTVLSGVNYKPFGPASSWTYGNGLVQTDTYDLDYRLTDRDIAGKQDLHFDYDEVNNIQNITNALNNGYSQTFDYDNVYRLSSITSSADNQVLNYDDVGNRLTHTDNGLSYTYTYKAGSNKVDKVSRSGQIKTLQTDSNGNITSDNVRGNSYLYNELNQLEALLKGGVTTSYGYNAMNQRMFKQTGSSTERYVYDPSGLLLAEPNSAREYIYFNGMPVAYVKSNVLYFVHSDQLARPEVITDAAKAVVWRANLKAFDRTVQTTSIGDFNLGFPGQYYDTESGLWYNWNRYYDAALGRYIQSDPVGLLAGANTYTYSLSNPVGFVDPNGLQTCLLTVRNRFNIGVHSAVQMTNLGTIYDPNGGYAKNNGGGEYVNAGNAEGFNTYHKGDGHTVESQCKSTSKQQELNIESAIINAPTSGILGCSMSASGILNASGVFNGIQPGTFWPGDLSDQFRNATVKGGE